MDTREFMKSMKFEICLALLALQFSASAGAEHWVEIARDNAPDGGIFFVDRDSLKVRQGIVFLRAQSRNWQTVTMSGGVRYDYQIGEFAVNCRDKTMSGLGNAFYLKDGTLIGEVPMSEDVVFDKGVVDKEMFSEMGPADTPWARKIAYACAWMKQRGKGAKPPSR